MSEKRIRLVRARKAAGFTQEELAHRLRVDRSTVGRWESGETEPLPWLQPKLARLLGVGRADLSAMLAVEIETRPETPGVDGELDADEQRHLTAALADARRYLDGPVVQYFHRQIDVCMTDDGVHGPSRTLPTVLGLLGAIEQSARDVRFCVLGDLLSAGARAAEFAAWLYRDLQNHAAATAWYSRGTDWAQQARDTAAQGYILLKRSQMAYEDRDARRVLTFAQAAQYGPWNLPDHLRAEVTQQEARGLAMVGEPLAVVEQKLADARELFAAASSAVEPPGKLSTYFNDASLTLRNASCYIEAGKPRHASVLYRQVLADDVLSRRDRGYFLARLASSLALAGEPDDAAESGLEAAPLASATASRRTIRELKRSLVTLQPWQHRPGPRALQEAVGLP